MKTSLTRILKALCVTAAVTVLSACGGASSTVDPFRPTRVIGLGDSYALATNSVVSQVAANFGQSNVISNADASARIDGLSTQIANIPGGVTSTDLVVISVGTNDLKGGMLQVDFATKVGTVVAQIQGLLGTVKHVLVMPVLDVSRTPWGRSNNFDTSATGAFNAQLLTQLSANFGSRKPNPVLYGDAGLSPISSQFLGMTYSASPVWVSPFNQYDFYTACNSCLLTASLFDTTPTTGSDTYLTTTGMQWAGNLLYNATAQGWR